VSKGKKTRKQRGDIYKDSVDDSWKSKEKKIKNMECCWRNIRDGRIAISTEKTELDHCKCPGSLGKKDVKKSSIGRSGRGRCCYPL